MPELPEVETIRIDLRKKILHKKIKDVEITPKARVNMNHPDFVKSLKGKEFVGIDRIGKLIIFRLSGAENKRSNKMSRANFVRSKGEINFSAELADQFVTPKYLLVHLKMTGQLIFARGRQLVGGGHSDNNIPLKLPDNSTRVILNFVDGGKLYFNDVRRFGYLKIVELKELAIEKAKYGIEPLQPNFNLVNFKSALKNRKTSIKAVLLNQKLIAGIGNIYADEACFLAGIMPSTKVDKLTDTQVVGLHKAIEIVIKKAILKRGTTFNHFRDSDGNKGNFLQFLQVYGRGGEKCKKCSSKLVKIKVVGRGTVYCPKCQK